VFLKESVIVLVMFLIVRVHVVVKLLLINAVFVVDKELKKVDVTVKEKLKVAMVNVDLNTVQISVVFVVVQEFYSKVVYAIALEISLIANKYVVEKP